MTLEVTGKLWFWKGPAPHHFVTVPDNEAREIKSIEKLVTYGWGMIPATVHIGKSKWKTALWPKDGSYIVPIKAAIRRAERLEEGNTVTLRLEM